MVLLQINNLSFSYSKYDDFALSIPHFELNQGERVALIGPNGAGKTTFLQIIALLQRPDKGTILFNNKELRRDRDSELRRDRDSELRRDRDSELRRDRASELRRDRDSELRSRAEVLDYHRATAFVPQRPVLYNRSVRDNVAIGLKIRSVSPAEISERVEKMLKALKIEHLSSRNALSISGGEARRVMLARALVLNPRILFLDEPFADLDEPVRRSIIEDTLPILSASGCATIFVTHNQDETYQLANRFMVMIKGQIIQSGTAYEIFGNPATKEVAEFIGIRNILPAEVVGENEGMFQLLIKPGIHLWYSGERPKGKQVLCCIPPEAIIVVADGYPSHASARNTLQGAIKKVIPSRYLVWLEIDIGGVSLTASVTHQSVKELGLSVGKPVSILLKATAIQLLEKSPDSTSQGR